MALKLAFVGLEALSRHLSGLEATAAVRMEAACFAVTHWSDLAVYMKLALVLCPADLVGLLEQERAMLAHLLG